MLIVKKQEAWEPLFSRKSGFKNMTIGSSSTSQVEIVVFGPGDGESVLINIPEVGWGVVDSCVVKTKGKKTNPALEFLKKKEVSRLAFVALTHPHEDHFAGFDEIITHFLGRIDRVCFYAGIGLREYRYYLLANEVLGGQGLDPLARVFQSFNAAQQGGAAKVAISERTSLIDTTCQGHPVQILGLAPSAESQERYCRLLFDAIPKKEGDLIGGLSGREHNLISVALLCRIGEVQILLGGDVELGKNDQTGWRGVIGSPDCPSLSSDVIKVPHHGSEGAFSDEVWSRFCESKKPLSIVTPFINLSNPLPREDGLKKIYVHSDKIAITAIHKFVQPKKVYDRTVVKNIRGVKEWRCLLDNDDAGYVRICLSISDGKIQELEIVPPAFLYENIV